MNANSNSINPRRQLKRLIRTPYALYFLILSLTVSGCTIWAAYSQYLDYRYYQNQVAIESTNAIGPQISAFIKEKSRLVSLYAQKNLQSIIKLYHDPENDQLREAMSKDLGLYFPQMLAFTLANANGEPYWEDFDGLIGELCRSELQQFAAGETVLPTIHPIYNGYHFDVMTQVHYQGETHILFVSFLASVLGDLLSAAKTPDHELMLILPKKDDLIEVVPGGARDLIERQDYRMQPGELQRILLRKPVHNTQWDVVDLIADGVMKRYTLILIMEISAILLVFNVTGLTLVLRLWKADNAREKAEQHRHLAQQQKDAMMAMVAHEFRTPLTAISGALDMLEMTLEDGSVKARELQNIALRNTQRLQFLVNDFVDLKQLESSEFKLDIAQIDLCGIVSESIVANSTYAKRFNVTLSFDKPAAAIWIQADGNRISQVLSNLISNAIKYGGANKTVSLRICKNEQFARVEVSDQGEGVPEEFHANLFKSFSKLAKNNKVKSSGLGLSIVKSIIEKHQGRAGFEFSEGHGSTFYFELPLAATGSEPRQDQQPGLKIASG